MIIFQSLKQIHEYKYTYVLLMSEVVKICGLLINWSLPQLAFPFSKHCTEICHFAIHNFILHAIVTIQIAAQPVYCE
jgi:hypothetical protein